MPVLKTLQWKVAVEPSVALSDEGVLANSGTTMQKKKKHTI